MVHQGDGDAQRLLLNRAASTFMFGKEEENTFTFDARSGGEKRNVCVVFGLPSPSYITLHYINVLANYITLQAEKVRLHYITAPQARNFTITLHYICTGSSRGGRVDL